MARPSEGESKMKGRGLVLHEPTRPRAALSLPTAGHRERAGGPQRGPADIRSPRNLPADRCCCGASLLGSQGSCLGPASGSVCMEPRLGASLPLMVSAGHTDTRRDTHTHRHTDKCHVQTWTHLCLKHKWGLRPRVVIRHLGQLAPSPGTLAVPLKKPQPPRPTSKTSSTENKQAQSGQDPGQCWGPCGQQEAGHHLPTITP